MTDFEFNPPTAEAIASASQGLQVSVGDLAELVGNLRLSNGCGSFKSGSTIEKTLENLGNTAGQMSARLTAAINTYERTVINAGGLITQQEAENKRSIAKAGEGKTFRLLLPGYSQ